VIGEGASIGPYCIIGPEVVIGPDCRLIGHVHVTAQTTIGVNGRRAEAKAADWRRGRLAACLLPTSPLRTQQ
jgi:NDP-sugar pyrophosphorylase family protein